MSYLLGPRSVAFTVNGTPQARGSKRPFVLKKGPRAGQVVTPDDNPKSKDWMAAVADKAADTMRGRSLLVGPLALTLTFTRRRPLAHFHKDGRVRRTAPKYPDVRPDLTKLLRGTEDALRGIVWRDDAQVVRQVNEKAYGNPEGVEVHVQELE